MPYQCNSCEMEVIWLKHHETMKSNPVEAKPAKDGNLVIDRAKGLYRFATENEKETAKLHNKNLYISHFANCKFAKEHRK